MRPDPATAVASRCDLGAKVTATSPVAGTQIVRNVEKATSRVRSSQGTAPRPLLHELVSAHGGQGQPEAAASFRDESSRRPRTAGHECALRPAAAAPDLEGHAMAGQDGVARASGAATETRSARTARRPGRAAASGGLCHHKSRVISYVAPKASLVS